MPLYTHVNVRTFGSYQSHQETGRKVPYSSKSKKISVLTDNKKHTALDSSAQASDGAQQFWTKHVQNSQVSYCSLTQYLLKPKKLLLLLTCCQAAGCSFLSSFPILQTSGQHQRLLLLPCITRRIFKPLCLRNCSTIFIYDPAC